MEIVDYFRPGSHVYFVGIKGTGVCALAELMHRAGIAVSGSDINEKFYTDAVLEDLGIPYYEDFDSGHIGSGVDLIVYSAAYSVNDNPELAEAERLAIPILKYPDALGAWSMMFDSSGIAGVHGKTTTTAMAGVLAKALNLPAQILAGSAVPGFNGRSTISLGGKYFIAETCEYRSHFLAFHPRRVVLTAIESDHQDCFPDYNSILNAFLDYCRLIPPGGELIYCADDPGASQAAGVLKQEGRDIKFIPYGFSVTGAFGIRDYRVHCEKASFSISSFPGEFNLRIPGKHQALNAAAGLALCTVLLQKELEERNGAVSSQTNCEPKESVPEGWNTRQLANAQKALEEFQGSKRRCEIIGEAGGVLFMDDYGHHPTAISATLSGLKEFYPHRRLIVSFMSHTFTRTAALLREFAACFYAADILFLHEIYSSAREHYEGGVNGESLFNEINKLHKDKYEALYYFDKPMQAFTIAREILRSGDLFITMGAGNNWPLGLALFNSFKENNL